MTFPPAHAGYEAYYENLPPSANPYSGKVGEESQAEAWEAGYIRAMDEESDGEE